MWVLKMHPIYAPVAQTVEHLTFNQGVRSSSLRRSTNKKPHGHAVGLFVGAPFTEDENFGLRSNPEKGCLQPSQQTHRFA